MGPQEWEWRSQTGRPPDLVIFKISTIIVKKEENQIYSGNQCRISPILGKKWAFFVALSSWYNDKYPLKLPTESEPAGIRERDRGLETEGRGRQTETGSRRFLSDKDEVIGT